MQTLDAVRDPRSVDALLHRQQVGDRDLEDRVRQILDEVQKEGDEALTTLTRQLDCKFIDSLGLRVSERDVEAAFGNVSKQFLKALRIARKNIRQFHAHQRIRSWSIKSKGSKLQQRMNPLKRVGIYIPGGKASYPSTVLMNAIPASVAGVAEIVMVTPCNAEGKIAPEVLVAARECGVSEIYRIGGAQAIAALAFGTESIRRVDKITGPGNAYVAAAKQMVYGRVGIDVIAGPTEVVVVADATARPEFVAADMIAQAEHDERASAILVTTSAGIARQVEREISRQLESAPRRAIVQRSLDGQGTIILVESLTQAARIVNDLAPEHLEVIVKKPNAFVDKILNAGSIFVGPWSTEALGDYVAGPNHTLPTSGTARFSSALSVYDFMKFTNVIEFTRGKFEQLGPHVEVLAEAEGLFGHAASVRVRKEAL